MGNLIPNSESQSNTQDEDSKIEDSSSDNESEDLLMSQKPIMMDQGPINGSHDHHPVYTQKDMRHLDKTFRQDTKSEPTSFRDGSETVTPDEVAFETNSSEKNLLKDYSSQKSLSTMVETSGSGADSEGSSPEENTGPRSEHKNKHKTLVTNQNKKKRKSQKRRRTDRMRVLDSETKRYRLIQTYLLVKDKHGRTRRVKTALDTQSNVSYAKSYLGQKRSWENHECKLVKGLGGYSESDSPLTTYVVKGKNVISLDTRSPPPQMFKDPEGP